MVSTRDGHKLTNDDLVIIITLDENHEFIESSIICCYKGFFVKDNRPAIASLTPGCSGMPMPETQTMHRFVAFKNPQQQFDLLEHDVEDTVIKDSSSMEEVVKFKLKD